MELYKLKLFVQNPFPQMFIIVVHIAEVHLDWPQSGNHLLLTKPNCQESISLKNIFEPQIF